MFIDEFLRRLESGSIAPVILLLGEEEFIKETAWKSLLEKVVPEGGRRFNGERLLAREHTMGDVLERLSTVPMFGRLRLVYLQNVDGWAKDQLKQLETYLGRPLPTACLVLSHSQKKGFERLQGIVEETGVVVQCRQPSEGEALRWLQSRARRSGKTLSPRAATFLVEGVGLNLQLLNSELEKLLAYAGSETEITLSDAREITSSQRVFSVFEVLRYVAQGNTTQAVASLRKLMLSGESPLGVLALLARQVRLIWQVKDALARKVTLADFSRKTNLPRSVANNYAEQAALFTEEELRRFHRLLRETDLRLKSTATPAETLMEWVVMELCRRQPRNLR